MSKVCTGFVPNSSLLNHLVTSLTRLWKTGIYTSKYRMMKIIYLPDAIFKLFVAVFMSQLLNKCFNTRHKETIRHYWIVYLWQVKAKLIQCSCLSLTSLYQKMNMSICDICRYMYYIHFEN